MNISKIICNFLHYFLNKDDLSQSWENIDGNFFSGTVGIKLKIFFIRIDVYFKKKLGFKTSEYFKIMVTIIEL